MLMLDTNMLSEIMRPEPEQQNCGLDCSPAIG